MAHPIPTSPTCRLHGTSSLLVSALRVCRHETHAGNQVPMRFGREQFYSRDDRDIDTDVAALLHVFEILGVIKNIWVTTYSALALIFSFRSLGRNSDPAPRSASPDSPRYLCKNVRCGLLLLLVKVAPIIEVNALTDEIEGVVVPVRFRHETPLALIESPRKARTLLIPRKSRSFSAFSVSSLLKPSQIRWGTTSTS